MIQLNGSATFGLHASDLIVAIAAALALPPPSSPSSPPSSSPAAPAAAATCFEPLRDGERGFLERVGDDNQQYADEAAAAGSCGEFECRDDASGSSTYLALYQSSLLQVNVSLRQSPPAARPPVISYDLPGSPRISQEIQ